VSIRSVRIAVRAAGVNPSDWKKRAGLMDEQLPQTSSVLPLPTPTTPAAS
jgi:NADPH:quinone reductase-like Zn-dependent oxidoreductase